jgi:hypothetical protein
MDNYEEKIVIMLLDCGMVFIADAKLLMKCRKALASHTTANEEENPACVLPQG